MPVMRRMTWSAMDETARAALCARGLEAIFDEGLKASIGRIIDDVRANGDEAFVQTLLPQVRAGIAEASRWFVNLDELMEAGTYLSFGPDTLVEARNRGYKPHASVPAPDAEKLRRALL